MNFYNRQHEFYCGIDLHANSMHVCVVDHDGHKHCTAISRPARPDRFLSAIGPFASGDLVIGCESTFNWYWLADLCRDQQLKFLLGSRPVPQSHSWWQNQERSDRLRETGHAAPRWQLSAQLRLSSRAAGHARPAPPPQHHRPPAVGHTDPHPDRQSSTELCRPSRKRSATKATAASWPPDFTAIACKRPSTSMWNWSTSSRT